MNPPSASGGEPTPQSAWEDDPKHKEQWRAAASGAHVPLNGTTPGQYWYKELRRMPTMKVECDSIRYPRGEGAISRIFLHAGVQCEGGKTHAIIEEADDLTFGSLVQGYGGFSWRPAIQGAKIHALKAARLGAPWITRDPRSALLHFKKNTKKHRSEFDKDWAAVEALEIPFHDAPSYADGAAQGAAQGPAQGASQGAAQGAAQEAPEAPPAAEGAAQGADHRAPAAQAHLAQSKVMARRRDQAEAQYGGHAWDSTPCSGNHGRERERAGGQGRGARATHSGREQSCTRL